MEIKQYELKQTEKFHTKKFLIVQDGAYYRLEYFKSLNTTTCIYKFKQLEKKKYEMSLDKYRDVDIFVSDGDKKMIDMRIAKHLKPFIPKSIATCISADKGGIFERMVEYVCKGKDESTLKVIDDVGNLCTVNKDNFILRVSRI